MATPSASRLLIHAQPDQRGARRSFQWPLVRLRAWYPDGPWQEKAPPLNLQIDDLHGHRLLAIDDAGPLVDLPLPAGTYQVEAKLGNARRGYTVLLQAGARVDLYLQLLPSRA